MRNPIKEWLWSLVEERIAYHLTLTVPFVVKRELIIRSDDATEAGRRAAEKFVIEYDWNEALTNIYAAHRIANPHWGAHKTVSGVVVEANWEKENFVAAYEKGLKAVRKKGKKTRAKS
jgi:hypothetical protein